MKTKTHPTVEESVESLTKDLIEYADEIDRPEERYQMVKFEVQQTITSLREDAVREVGVAILKELPEWQLSDEEAIRVFLGQWFNLTQPITNNNTIT